MPRLFLRQAVKYLALLGAFFKASLMSEMEYRFNILARFVTDILWYAAQLAVFEVLFTHTSTLNGWTLDQMRVFMGTLFITDALYMMLFSENLDKLDRKVQRGELDLLLVKPVNSQMILSFQKVSIAYIGNLLFSIGLLVWALMRITETDPDASLWRLLWLLATVPIGLSIGYAIRFMISTTALYFTKTEAINYIWYQLYRLGTRPDTLYPLWLKWTVLTVLPIGFLASVPAKVLLGKDQPWVLLWGTALAIVLLWCASRFWQRGLKAYSSASS